MGIDGDVLDVARARLIAESEAIRGLVEVLDESFVQAAMTVFACTGKVFVGGSGTSGAAARRMAHILSVSGTPAVFISPVDGIHGASGAIANDDMVILISNGGASTEVIELAKIADSRGARVLAITSRADTPLAMQAGHSVVISVQGDADIGGVIATGITLAQSAWGDALAEVLMRARGYTWEQVMQTHPAGAVGMRESLPGDLPQVSLDAVTSGGAG